MDMKTFVRANADRVIAAGLVIAGCVALIVGWFGVSGSGLAAEQLPYLVSGGIGGIVLVVIGCTVWVSADLQDDWRKLDAIEERLDRLEAAGEVAPVAGVPDRDKASTNGRSGSRRPRRTASTDIEA
jgi:hypothetical protein